MRISLLACVLLLLTTSAYAQTSLRKAWKLYTFKGEELSVALPAPPVLQSDMGGDASNEPPRQQSLLDLFADGIRYTVYSVDNKSAPQSLESFIQAQFQKRRFSYSYAAAGEPQVDGTSGKAFLLGARRGMAQFFSTNDRLYHFMVEAPPDDPRVTKFFSSLSFKKNRKAIEVPEEVTTYSSDLLTEKVYMGQEVDQKIRLLSKPHTHYTQKARDAGVWGTVVLKCVFSSSGKVTNCRVVIPLPKGMSEQALNAARQIKFVPAVKDGKNVSMWLQLEYNFNQY